MTTVVCRRCGASPVADEMWNSKERCPEAERLLAEDPDAALAHAYACPRHEVLALCAPCLEGVQAGRLNVRLDDGTTITKMCPDIREERRR